MRRIVLKIGTSALQRPNGKLDYNVISELCDTIAAIHHRGHRVLLVSSGAIGAGREVQSFEHEKDALRRKQMMAAVGQVRLVQIYSDFFRESHTTIAQILVSRSDFAHRESFINVRNTLEGLLRSKVLPIINENDVVATDEIVTIEGKPDIGDNDRLALYIALLTEADDLFFLTTTPGVYKNFSDAEGQRKEIISSITEVDEELLALCQNGTSSGGTGGMLSKVKSAGVAMSHGINTTITSGKEVQNILNILDGESIGTRFIAKGKKLKHFSKWLESGVLEG